MIVVDLGCADHGKWASLEALADKYQPSMIYGFDPSPDLDTSRTTVAGVPCVLERKAAWHFDGEISYTDGLVVGPWGTVGTVGPWSWPTVDNPMRVGVVGEGPLTVECFDLAAWLIEHGPAVVKMDVEGSEYLLLRYLAQSGVQHLVSGLVIEWHHWIDESVLALYDCPVERWWM